MNKDEIKKALKRCLSNDCDNCPYYDDDECRDILIDAALTLITKQEKEIEQLKDECEYRKKQYDTQVAENTRLHIEYDKAFERLKAQQREIDALQEENRRLGEYVSCTLSTADLDEEIKQAKIDVLNELKEKHSTSGNTFAGWITFVPNDDIDEMIEEVKNAEGKS